MASQRSSVPHTPNRWAASVARARRAGRAILDLTSSNPTRVGLAYPEAELLDALDDAQALVYRPEPCGARPAREAVAGALATRGVHLPWQNVVLTASTSEGYSYLLKLLCDAGDQVLAPRPSYPLLEHLARLVAVE